MKTLFAVVAALPLLAVPAVAFQTPDPPSAKSLANTPDCSGGGNFPLNGIYKTWGSCNVGGADAAERPAWVSKT